MRARLLAACEPGGTLATWADTYGYPLPSVEVGYRAPVGADGWPFLCLVPVRDQVDLRLGFARALDVAVACGVLAAEQDRAGLGAQVALDALASAAVAILADPLAYAVGEDVLIADTAALTDQVYQHPRYQAETLLSLNNSRGSDG